MQNNALNIKGNQINDQTLNKILNISIELKKAIASGNVQTIEKRNKEHHLSMQKLIGICPYCNPNWHDVPNLPEAMKGYDVPNGNPDPGLFYFLNFNYNRKNDYTDVISRIPILHFRIEGMGRYDPGIRREIFNGMRTTKHGLQELNGNFLTANPLLKCDSQWSEKIYHTFDDYVR